MEQLDPQAVNLAKAIRQTESGGDFKAQGKSGEFGAYQFTEPTWASSSKKYLGQEVPLQQATPEQQNEVAYKQIKDWKDAGYNVGEIASMWNAGEKNPQAYLENNVGINKYGVKFNTPAYAKSVATAYQTIKNGGQVGIDQNNPSSVGNTYQENQPKAPSQPQNKEGFLASLIRGITGPVVSSIARPIQLGAELLGATPEQVDIASSKVPFYGENNYLATPKTYSDVTKDVGRAAQTVALGMPVGTVGKALQMGAVSGAGGGLEQTGTVGGTVKGGLIGSALGAIGGGISKALESIPQSLTESAFQGLKPAQIEQALRTKSAGTAQSLLNQSQKAVSNYGQQIEKILSETPEQGAGNFAVRSTIQQFPEFASEKGTQQMLARIKRLIPSGPDGFEGMNWNRGEISNLIDKIADGSATLLEKNRVRSAIDSATTGGYTKLAKAMNPSAGHDLAMTFANALRSEVQGSVKETQPIFAEFSKEVAFKKAVEKAMKKNPSKLLQWRDIIPFLGGQALGGPLGGIGTVMLGRAVENPAAKFAAAKGAQAAGKVISPVASRGGLVGQLINR